MVKREGRRFGVIVWAIRLQDGESRSWQRYVFRFPDYRRDDSAAEAVADALLHAVSILVGPIAELCEPPLVFLLPMALVRARRTLTYQELIKLDQSTEPWKTIAIFGLLTVFRQAWGFSDARVEMAWRIAAVTVHDEKLRRAVWFLKASHDNFYVWPGELDEVLANPDHLVWSGVGQTRAENALHNAFKAVEAIIGDPPKDDQKLFQKMSAAGLDPNEPVGYHTEAPLYSVIRTMSRARDTKSAHGSTDDRKLRILEITEYQALAEAVVLAAIEHKRGAPLDEQ